MPIKMKVINNIGRCQAAFRKSELDIEIPPGRHAYVLAICKEPGRTQDALASDLCVNKSSVARVLDAFEELGYVERKPSAEDKRCLLVYPTEKMLSIYPKIREVTLRWNSLLTEDIPERELEIFNSVLMRIEESARKIFKGLSEENK